MIRMFVIVLSILLPLPALALSCAPFEPKDAFRAADDAMEVYHVVHGGLEFDPAALPETGAREPSGTAVPGWVRGRMLTREGFTSYVSIPVTLRVQCIGPWCGHVMPGDDILMFIENSGEGYFLDVSPCGGMLFPEPSRADLDAMQSCLRGGCR